MKPVECEFESDVLAAALESRWPDQVSADLRAHVAECPICSDVAAIASAIDGVRQETQVHAVIPDSGRVWWLAQMRARREAAKAAGRPITAIQVLSFACAMGLLGACFGATSTWFQSSLNWIGSSVQGFDAQALLAFATAILAKHAALVVTLAALILLVPAAVYLVIVRE